MEVYQTEKFYIFVKKEKSLWWNRRCGEFEIKNGKQRKNCGKIDFLLFFCGRIFSLLWFFCEIFAGLIFVIIDSLSIGINLRFG